MAQNKKKMIILSKMKKTQKAYFIQIVSVFTIND